MIALISALAGNGRPALRTGGRGDELERSRFAVGGEQSLSAAERDRLHHQAELTRPLHDAVKAHELVDLDSLAQAAQITDQWNVKTTRLGLTD